MTYDETEIVADAGVRLRIIADGLIAQSDVLEAMYGVFGPHNAGLFREFGRLVDEVRVRLCALPIEAEGEAA